MEHAPKLIKIDGEWQYVPLTEEEIVEREAFIAEQNALIESERIQAEARELAKQAAKESAIAKLAALGLTEEEAAAIVGV